MFSLLFFGSLFEVSALTVKPEGTTNTTPGGTLVVNVMANRTTQEASLSSVACNLTYSNTLELKSKSIKVNGWSYLGNENDDNYFLVGDNATPPTGKTETAFSILQLNFKVSDNAIGTVKVNLENCTATDPSGNSINANFVNYSAVVKSTDNNLNNIIVSSSTANLTMSPSFSSSTTNYKITAPSSVDRINIAANKSNAAAKVTGEGNHTLVYGENTLKVVVTSEAGTVKTYTIVVTREDDRSTDNTLKDITVDSGSLSPAFKSDISSYVVEVASDVESINIGAILNNDDASFTANFGPRKINLNKGSNPVLLKVKAENGQEKIYTIEVIRDDGRSADNTLSSVIINDRKVTLKKSVYEYSVDILYTKDILNMLITPSDIKAKYKTSIKNPLVVGENILTITVTAENTTEKIYTIKVNMLAEGVNFSTNANLSNLAVSGYSLNFKANQTKYKLNLKDEESLQIVAVTEDDTATYEIIGNSDLKNGSIIKVVVTAQDGSVKTYTIEIEKTSGLLYVGIGLICLSVLLIVIFIVKIVKKKNEAMEEITQ